ncbi:MAG: DciA family protein [Nitrospirota bacterium]
MRPTETLIPSLFASFGLTAKLDEHRLIAAWPRIVGPQIAAHAAPQEVRGKTLWVVVDSSTWLHQLTLLKPLLLAKLGPHVGKAVVRDVRFVIGEVSAPADTGAAPPLSAAPLTPEDEAAVDQAVSALPDADLRESLARLLRRAAAKPRRGR